MLPLTNHSLPSGSGNTGSLQHLILSSETAAGVCRPKIWGPGLKVSMSGSPIRGLPIASYSTVSSQPPRAAVSPMLCADLASQVSRESGEASVSPRPSGRCLQSGPRPLSAQLSLGLRTPSSFSARSGGGICEKLGLPPRAPGLPPTS